ncbi:MAG: hypothetical protein ACLUJG_10985 [Lawsonibacter sp.]
MENPLEALYVQLSVDWLKQFGVHVENSQDYKHYHVEGGQTFTACECTVPSDWSRWPSPWWPRSAPNPR